MKKSDLLFIDGDHSYEGCRRDVESWIPHLNTGGLIAMHDYGWADGVRKVVTETVLPSLGKEVPKLAKYVLGVDLTVSLSLIIPTRNRANYLAGSIGVHHVPEVPTRSI